MNGRTSLRLYPRTDSKGDPIEDGDEDRGQSLDHKRYTGRTGKQNPLH